VIARSRRLAALAAGACVLAGAHAGAANAASPAWLPVATTGPTVIPPVQSETQRIYVDADGGAFTLTAREPAASGVGAFQVPNSTAVSGVSASTGSFAVGQTIEGFGIPDGTTIVEAGSGTLTLSQPVIFRDSQVELLAYGAPATTAPIPFDASAADVQAALEGLASVGPGNVEVSGGPGGPGGDDPYVVVFKGDSADTNVSQLSAGSGLLDGAANVRTPVQGGRGTSRLALMVQNVGGAVSSGEMTLRATLPPGITAIAVPTGPTGFGAAWACGGSSVSEVVCTRSTPVRSGLSAPFVNVLVTAAPGTESGVVEMEVSGGGAATATGELSVSVSSVSAGPGVQTFAASAWDENGVFDGRAGGHPYSATTAIFPNTVRSMKGAIIPVADVEDLVVSLPPGFVGNPQAVPACPESTPVQDCPRETMVGTVEPAIQIYGERNAATPLFNSEGSYGYPAKFRFRVLETTDLNVVGSVRSHSDFGVDAGSLQTPQIDQFLGALVTLWGQPADPSHNSVRCAAQKLGIDQAVACQASTAANNAFLTSPTDCEEQGLVAGMNGGLVPVGLSSTWWQVPGLVASNLTGVPAVSDCGPVPFDPSVTMDPSSSAADAPTGLDVGMQFPHDGLLDPAGRDSSHLKRAVVVFPAGLTINPSAANGLDACTDTQLNLKSKAPVSCPDASKVATATATSPLLAQSLSGSMFIRTQNSMDPESGEMFRVGLVLENKERGISVRLPGEVRADADTGRLTAVFDNNPRLPVGDIEIRIKGGSTAPLATPKNCGTHEIKTTLTPWSAPDVADDVSSDPFEVDCAPGLGSFGPALTAGTVSPVGRSFSPFVLKIDKQDGQPDIDGVTATLPTGLLATLKGNVGTRVGTAKVAAGPGDSPFWLSGPVVLEGPYGNAPFSLRVTVPAVAGPFNLGDVVVRQKIYVNRSTGQVSVASDPVPTLVKGVQARLQEIRVEIDKPGFTLNPSNCSAKQVATSLHANTGAAATAATRFQATACANLPFKPTLSLALTGKRQVTTGKHPGVKAVVTQAGVGEAGIEKAVVRLPKSLALDPENAQALCEFADGIKDDLENHCPPGSIVGRARAISPLLNQPLAGNVYFVKNIRIDPHTGNQIRTLPMLIVALRGEVAINLKGESSTTKAGRLVNTFANVPDAPISQFNLNINGGQNGILAVTRTRKAKINLCTGRHTAETDMDAQNGRRHDFDVRMKTPCTKKQTKAAKRQAKRAAAKTKRS
jgi:hypothetical protein